MKYVQTYKKLNPDRNESMSAFWLIVAGVTLAITIVAISSL